MIMQTLTIRSEEDLTSLEAQKLLETVQNANDTTVGAFCEALNESAISYTNWQPSDGYEEDDRLESFCGVFPIQVEAKDHLGNWHYLEIDFKHKEGLEEL